MFMHSLSLVEEEADAQAEAKAQEDEGKVQVNYPSHCSIFTYPDVCFPFFNCLFFNKEFHFIPNILLLSCLAGFALELRILKLLLIGKKLQRSHEYRLDKNDKCHFHMIDGFQYFCQWISLQSFYPRCLVR